MIPSEIHNKRILFSALNWGMGHVSRSIGLIEQLEKNQNSIHIACNQAQKAIFSEYFPHINFIEHDGYPFKFKGKGNFENDLLLSFRGLKNRLKNELNEVDLFVKKNEFDIIISDHRYGFRSDKVPSIFITHQLNLPVKWYGSVVQKWHEKLLKKFDYIWVLDFEDNRLAGKLSVNKKGLDVDYIGPYSRFMLHTEKVNQNGVDVLIASGPLVYAEQFIEGRLSSLNPENTLLIASDLIETSNEWQRVSNNWKEQDEVILNASKIISRSGYSTIMDLYFLQKPFEIYPTKGQAEQEYLAELTLN